MRRIILGLIGAIAVVLGLGVRHHNNSSEITHTLFLPWNKLEQLRLNIKGQDSGHAWRLPSKAAFEIREFNQWQGSMEEALVAAIEDRMGRMVDIETSVEGLSLSGGKILLQLIEMASRPNSFIYGHPLQAVDFLLSCVDEPRAIFDLRAKRFIQKSGMANSLFSPSKIKLV